MSQFLSPATRQLIVIDSQVNDYQTLAGALAGDSNLLILDASSDGLSQISDYLKALPAHTFQSIQIISHGSAGRLLLGSSTLTGHNLSAYPQQLATIGNALTEQGDILLYGCNVAADPVGLQFVNQFAALTGAEVAASDDITGGSGDWQLEVTTGEVDSAMGLEAGALSSYSASLAVNTAPVFSFSSMVTTDFASGNDSGSSVIRQPDGKLVVAGYSYNGRNNDFALVRYTATGSLDTSFGSGGKVTTAIGSRSYDRASSVILQPDGKLVVAGSRSGTNDDFALARYTATGSLDTSFGSGGKVTTTIGSGFDGASSVILQPNGKLVVAGTSDNGSNADFALVRYTATGSLDASFGSGGKVTTAIGSSYDSASSLILQPDGKLVVAGTSDNGSNADFALVRYTPTGSLDTSFGSDGKVTTAISSGEDSASSVILQPDGKLVVAGSSYNRRNADVALVRYTATGSLDTSFGSGGKVTTKIGSGDDRAYSVILQPDGKLVVAGSSYNGSDGDVALVRYTATGSLDASFGSGGIVTTVIGSGDDYAHSVILQPDGKLVVAGTSDNGGNNNFTLVQYNADGSLATEPSHARYFEDSAPILLPLPAVSDAQLDAGNDYSGASIRLARQGGVNTDDVFSFDTTNTTFSIFDNFLVANQSVFANFQLSDGQLLIDFTGVVSQALINEVLQHLTYQNNAAALPASVSLELSVNDGNINNAQGDGGALTSTYVLTVDTVSVNDAPIGSDTTLTSPVNIPYTFKVSDFGFSDPNDAPANQLSTILITQLPRLGSLTLLGNPVTLNQAISTANIQLGVLKYTPDLNGSGAAYASMGFRVQDDGGTANGGLDTDTLSRVITFDIGGSQHSPTGEVSITGTATQGQTLTVSNTLADADGLGTIRYQWQADGVAITGATHDTYTLTQAEVGKTITVLASYTDLLGTAESKTSTATTAVANVNDLPTGTVTITGTPTQGQTLTASNTLADIDGLGTIGYQWQANGVAISGASNGTYTLTQAEVGKTITVLASYTDGLGTAESQVSAATSPITGLAQPGIRVTGTDFTTNEQGDTAVFSIALNTAPVRTVTITFASSDPTEGNMTPRTLTFTSTNWAIPQSLTITGQKDRVIDGNIAYTVTGHITTLDVLYKTVTMQGLTLTNQDAPVVSPANKATTGNDLLNGNSKSEKIDGLSGNDTLMGMSGNDTLLGSAGNDSVNGGVGNDILSGSVGMDTLIGDAGNDTLDGGPENDVLDGGAGNDKLTGGTGSDTLSGDTGNDTYFVDNTGDRIIEADSSPAGGKDTVNSVISFSLATIAGIENLLLTGTGNSNGIGNALNNTLTGNKGNNSLSGGSGNDTLNGNAGNDTLDGGSGIDKLIGGTGSDTYVVSNAEDRIIEQKNGGDQDTISTGGSFTLPDYIEILTLTGNLDTQGSGNGLANALNGNSGNNYLSGAKGNDSLFGNAGNDTLDGGTGNNVLNGGDGIDTVVFSSTQNNYQLTEDPANQLIVVKNIVNGGSNELHQIESLQFADTLLDISHGLPQTLNLSISDFQDNEGNDLSRSAQFTLTLSDQPSAPITLNYATIDGDATAGQDYVASSGSILFAVGETTKTISIPIIGDTLVENDEQFFLQITPPDTVTMEDNQATATLINDDKPTLTLTDVSIDEGNADSTEAQVIVNLSEAISQPVTVNYATVNGTAVNSSDYSSTSGMLTFLPGESRQLIRIPITGDTQIEANESFRLHLSSPQNAQLAAITDATITLINDDTPPPILNIETAKTITEGNSGVSTVTLSVNLSTAATQPITVNYATTNGTATAGTDYIASTGILSFVPGETSKIINISVGGDTDTESDETFNMVLSAPTNATLGNEASAVITITNDDNLITPNISITSSKTITEGNSGSSNAELTVSLSAASAQTVTVNYATADGSATAGSDYTATTGTLGFAPGETSKIIQIPILGDSTAENDEDFSVNLSAASNGILGASSSLITINNDDKKTVTANTKLFGSHSMGEWGNLLAFAAIKNDGSVITWGDSKYGGDSSSVADQLSSGVIGAADPFSDDIALDVVGNAVATTDYGFFG